MKNSAMTKSQKKSTDRIAGNSYFNKTKELNKKIDDLIKRQRSTTGDY
jgi:carboxyl-terminal processing protease